MLTMDIQARKLLAVSSVRRLWSLRSDLEARRAIRQWCGDLRAIKDAEYGRLVARRVEWLRPRLAAEPQQQIKVGDRVKCIDASASFHRLAEGAIYTVEPAYDGSPVVIVNRAYHSIERFEKAEPAQ